MIYYFLENSSVFGGMGVLLAIDIGNTQIKVGGYDIDKLVFVSRLHTNAHKSEDEYAFNLRDILDLNDCNYSQFDGAIISSVVPQLSGVFQRAVRKTLRSNKVYLIHPEVDTGLDIRIDSPGTLGSDIVCGAVCALNTYPLPCVVISLGTATVIYAVDENGAYRGTAISSGVGIALEALSAKTAQLPHISLDNVSDSVLGTNTVDSMKSGVVYGTASMIDGMIQRFQEALGGSATIVATGGLASSIVPYCLNKDIIIDEYVVLEGLRHIYNRNKHLPV